MTTRRRLRALRDGMRLLPYPQLSGIDLTEVLSHSIEVFNDAVPAATSGDVAEQIQHDPEVTAHLSDSSVVLIEGGANDVAYSAACGTAVACYDAKLPDLARHLTAIVPQVQRVADGRERVIALLDYWSVWLAASTPRPKATLTSRQPKP